MITIINVRYGRYFRRQEQERLIQMNDHHHDDDITTLLMLSMLAWAGYRYKAGGQAAVW